jgi:hypothetical protein
VREIANKTGGAFLSTSFKLRDACADKHLQIVSGAYGHLKVSASEHKRESITMLYYSSVRCATLAKLAMSEHYALWLLMIAPQADRAKSLLRSKPFLQGVTQCK